MRQYFGLILVISIILSVFACESEEAMQNEEDPIEMEVDTTEMDPEEQLPMDTMIVIVDGKEMTVSRFNAIKDVHPIFGLTFWLFIAEGENSERIELYHGYFQPTPNFAYRWQFWNYADNNGIFYTNGLPWESNQGGYHNSINEKDRFIGTFNKVLHSSEGDSIYVDRIKVNVAYKGNNLGSKMTYIIQTDTLKTESFDYIMFKDQTFYFHGRSPEFNSKILKIDLKIPHNISTGVYSLEDLNPASFGYQIIDQDYHFQEVGTLNITKIDFVERVVQGSFESSVIIDSTEQDFKFIFNYNRF